MRENDLVSGHKRSLSPCFHDIRRWDWGTQKDMGTTSVQVLLGWERLHLWLCGCDPTWDDHETYPNDQRGGGEHHFRTFWGVYLHQMEKHI